MDSISRNGQGAKCDMICALDFRVRASVRIPEWPVQVISRQARGAKSRVARALEFAPEPGREIMRTVVYML